MSDTESYLKEFVRTISSSKHVYPVAIEYIFRDTGSTVDIGCEPDTTTYDMEDAFKPVEKPWWKKDHYLIELEPPWNRDLSQYQAPARSDMDEIKARLDAIVALLKRMQ